MVTYIYFVKCPNCEDEHFDFFDDAKAFARGCMSKKPIITQTEVERNDFGECTDSADLGTIWSWEDECRDAECGDTEAEPTKSVFTKDDLKQYADDPEFKDDDDFFFNYGLVEEVAPTRFSFRNKEDFAEFTQLCREIGIIDGADLRKFMDETGANDDNLLDKLREYRAELGDDFEITEDFTDSGRFEYMGRHYDPIADFDTKALGFELGKTYSIIDSKDFAKANGAKIVPESVVCPADKTTSPENYFVRFSRNNKFELMDLQTFATFMKNAEKQIVECSERKPIPEGMTIKELVEEMEENEDTVECTWCNELFDKSECRKEVDLGWLCGRCEMAIKSRGETLTFRENNYWDFLDESVEDTRTLADLVKDSINHLTNDLGKDPWAEGFADEVIGDIERNYETYAPEDMEHYNHWCSAVASEVSRQLNNPDNLTEASLGDILRNVNDEYGTDYTEQGLIDSEGLEDADAFDDIETNIEIYHDAQERKRARRNYAINKAKAAKTQNETNAFDLDFPEV